MATLQDTVRTVVQEFMDNDELFTALDVSNKVKVLLPNARHHEVRAEVRSLFGTLISLQGWGRSPITVTLEDGVSTAEALLYHPLSASWDLDIRYDDQKRAQVAFNPAKVAAAAVSAASTATASVTAPTTASVTVSATTSVPMPTARDLWKQLFDTQPSLFPTK
jgi:hypothetical protein